MTLTASSPSTTTMRSCGDCPNAGMASRRHATIASAFKSASQSYQVPSLFLERDREDAQSHDRCAGDVQRKRARDGVGPGEGSRKIVGGSHARISGMTVLIRHVVLCPLDRAVVAVR